MRESETNLGILEFAIRTESIEIGSVYCVTFEMPTKGQTEL